LSFDSEPEGARTEYTGHIKLHATDLNSPEFTFFVYTTLV